MRRNEADRGCIESLYDGDSGGVQSHADSGVLKTVGFSGCRSLQTLQEAGHVLGNLFSLLRCIRFELCNQITVDYCAPNLGEEVRATRRPAHLLTLAHANIEHLVHRGFCHRRRNRFASPIALPVVDGCSFVALQVGKELSEPEVELLQTRLEFRRFGYDDAAQHQDLAHPLFSLLPVRVPEAPAQLADVFTEQLLCVLFRFRSRPETAYDLLQIPDTHGNVEPIEYGVGREWELSVNALNPVSAVGDYRKERLSRSRLRPHQSSHPFRSGGYFASYPGEDIRFHPRGGKATCQDLEVPGVCFSSPSDKPAVDRDRPFRCRLANGTTVTGSATLSIRAPTRNVRLRTVTWLSLSPTGRNSRIVATTRR